MKFEEKLTTENIKKRYPSQFHLVNTMISEARRIINTGANPDVDIDTDNVAVIVYSEFEQGRESVLDECEEEFEEYDVEEVNEPIPS